MSGRNSFSGIYCPDMPGIMGIDICWNPPGISKRDVGTVFSWIFLYSILIVPDIPWLSILIGKLSLSEIQYIAVPEDSSLIEYRGKASLQLYIETVHLLRSVVKAADILVADTAIVRIQDSGFISWSLTSVSKVSLILSQVICMGDRSSTIVDHHSLLRRNEKWKKQLMETYWAHCQ